MNYFLQDVARYLYLKHQGDFRNTIIVFPGRRASLFFNHFLSQLTDRPVWAPRYYTIEDLFKELSGLQKIDNLSLVFRLFEIFKKVTASQQTFDTFYYYCETILRDFDDIDKYGIRAEELFRNLRDLKAIEDYGEYLEPSQMEIIRNFWEIIFTSRPSSEKEQFVSLWEALGNIYSELSLSLEKDGLAYEGRICRTVLQKLNSAEGSLLDSHHVNIVGFNALNRSEELFFEILKKRGKASFFWDFDESYLKNEWHEAGFFLRKYIHRFPPPADFKSSSHIDPSVQKITTLAAPLAVAQAKIIENCLQLTGTRADSPLKTAIILADETLLPPVINSLPDNSGNVNITMGYPVIDSPAHSFLSSLIDLHKNRRAKENIGFFYEYYHTDLFGVLNHSFLGIRSLPEFQKFQEYCIKNNLVFIDPALLPVTDPVLDLIFSKVENASDFAAYAYGIIENIAEKINLEDQQYPYIKWQSEILFAVKKMLTRLEALIGETRIELSFTTVLSLLKQILRTMSVPFSGEPLTGLQILGVLETRTLDFENIIVLSMNEGKFPKTGHIPSMIPYNLREGFGLPTVRHQDSIYGYYFYRLLHHSRNVILVYNTQSKGLDRGEPSRFIYQMQFERNVLPEHFNAGYKVGQLLRKSITVRKTEKVFSLLEKYHDESNISFSPSALNTYIECSLRFYFRYIEGIREPEEVAEQIEGNVFGSILHAAMAEIYKPFINKICDEKAIHALLKNEEAIDQAIDHAFSAEYLGGDVKVNLKGRNLIIRHIIRRYIKGILQYDIGSSPFTIIAAEKYYGTTLKTDKCINPVKIGGKIDRVERTGGMIRVVDYKTGASKISFRDLNTLFEAGSKYRNSAVFQVFLYSWLLYRTERDKCIQPNLYFIRNIFEEGFSPVICKSENREKIKITDFSPYAEVFEGLLLNLINEIFSPEIPFTQTTETDRCIHCPFNEICMKEL